MHISVRLSCFALLALLLFANVKFTTSDKVNILPVDVAKEMRESSLAAGWSTANERLGSRSKAKTKKKEWKQHAADFKKESVGILSSSTCSDIKYMFWYQAWRTANIRKGYTSDAKRDLKEVNRLYKKIKKSGEMTSKLASNIKSMGWNIAWYCANTLKGYSGDAKKDKARYKATYAKIHGPITLKDVNFFVDRAKVLSTKPKVIAQQNIINRGSIQQSFTFDFEVFEGRTISVSHEISFTYGITTGLSAGFSVLGNGVEGSLEVSFEFTHTHTFSESIDVGETKSYSFPLVAAPHSHYVAKASVTEGKMEVPYELVFDFGGEKKRFYGTWTGVAVSSATYVITPVGPASQNAIDMVEE